VRIGLITHDFERTGGHSRYVVELARRFARDHEVHVFANTFAEPLPSGARAHAVRAVRRTALTTILSFAASRPGSDVPLDIVHAQGISGAPANVVTAHICNARWLEARRDPDGRVSYKDRFFAAAVVPLERRLFARSDMRAIAVSRVVAQDLVQCYRRTGAIDVIPHGVDPAQFEGMAFERFLLQPMDGPARSQNTEAAIAYCLAHPRWRLSVQTHKYLGIA